MLVNVDTLIADQGTVVVFTGLDPEDGRRLVIAVDHRMAQDIVDAIDDGPVPTFVELWQVLGRES